MIPKPKTAKNNPVVERLPNIHPGRVIRTQVLEARRLTQSEHARATGLPLSRINDLINARRSITVDSAIRLGKALGVPPQFWINLQVSYDLEEAMINKQQEYSAIKALPLPSAA